MRLNKENMSSYELFHGDCLDILPTLAAGSVDAVITSPPYAMQRKKQYGGIPEALYPDWTVAWLGRAKHCLKPSGSVFINIREHVKNGVISDYVHKMRLLVRDAGWYECDELIWIKPDAPPVGHPKRPRRSWERVLWFSLVRQPYCNPTANGRQSKRVGMSNDKADWMGRAYGRTNGVARSRDYVEAHVGGNTAFTRDVKHPARYPSKFAEWMIKIITPISGVVLDPFMGSGTTGHAAANTNRRFIGIERDEHYFNIASERIAAAYTPLPLFEAMQNTQ